MDLWGILGDIVVLLAASLLLGGIFSRMKQSPVVGYMLAGMLLGGPGSVHLVGSQHEIEAIAELGVSLLLFSLGLEFSLERLKGLGAKPLMGGFLQVVLTVVVVAGAAMLFGLSTKASIAFGAMVSVSSTAIVLRILMERAELDMPHGRNCLAVLLTQDVAVVPLALLMTILGSDGGMVDIAMSVGKLIAAGAGLVLVLYLLNTVAVFALGTLTLHRNRELTVILAVVTGLGAAWASHAIGVSPALGAFAAGMLLGSSAFATQIRADVSSLRVVLLTLFFSAVGMVADPLWIINHWYIVASVAALVMACKMIVIWGIFQGLGQTTRVASATGIALAQISEFAFVLGNIGRASGVVSPDLYALVVSITIVSFFVSAIFVPAAPRYGHIIARLLGTKNMDEDQQSKKPYIPDVIIIGFGPAGQLAAQPFVDKNIHLTVIDLNEKGIRKAIKLGFHGYVGDATQHDVLEHAQITKAKAVVITVPHRDAGMSILEHVRQHAPHVHIMTRSRHQIHTDDFIAAGSHIVVGDEEHVGASMATHLRHWLEAGAHKKLDQGV